MINFAFKRAAVAGGTWSKLIAWKTGGDYSHVEAWLSGPATNALCFSSREGSGCSFKIIDLSDTKLWDIVPIHDDLINEAKVLGFCMAMNAACVRYDYMGILGIGTGHGEHDDHDRFCSEVCVEILQTCLGQFPTYRRWLVSPSQLRGLLS